MPHLMTTLGPIQASAAAMVLPHEHVFVDLRSPDTPGHGQAQTAEVTRAMAPLLVAARQAGIGAIAEASCVGVGRRADILLAASEASDMPLIAPTGVYREPWIPRWVHEASEESLRDWMIGELEAGIEGSGVRAGWIKLSAGDAGLTPCETKVLKAAAQASRATGAVIGSHTISGRVVREQLDILGSLGVDPGRFIWIHAQIEPDALLALEAARRGAWIEYDAIGWPPPARAGAGADSDVFYAGLVRAALDAGLGHRVLLSQDRGWFDPAIPGGGPARPYTYLTERF
ncbi:MAG: esterase, partial [Spirochaetes bacterium]|nr:esterase [Spirochaetota bacterium]